MSQTKFNRGLDSEFVNHLNGLYDEPDGWWRGFVDDEELFLAIRENYVDIYYRGHCLPSSVTIGEETGNSPFTS